MAIEHENDCVGCPQGCVHCGRGDYAYVVCDGCGESDCDFIEINGNHYCMNCYLSTLPQKITFTPDGEEWTNYYLDGEWYEESEIEDVVSDDFMSEEDIFESERLACEPDPDLAYEMWRDREFDD